MTDEKHLVLDDTNDDIIFSDMDKREFKITIGIRSYWITKEEMEKYMTERTKPGAEYVALRDHMMILPVKFQDIVHRSVIEDSEKVEKGHYQCEYGKWHQKDGSCYCGDKWIEESDGTIRLEKAAPHLLAEESNQSQSFHSDNLKLPRLKSF